MACVTLLLALGCLAAAVAVLAGNRTAMALLASTIYSTVLCELDVPFNVAFGLAVDLAVIMWIIVGWAETVLRGGYGKQRDVAILALFLPIWALYFLPGLPWRPMAIDALIALQLLITFPIKRAFSKGKAFVTQLLRDDTGTMGRARHEQPACAR